MLKTFTISIIEFAYYKNEKNVLIQTKLEFSKVSLRSIIRRMEETMKEKRKTYFSSKKVGIIREQLKGGYILSQISEKYQIHLTQLLRWKKELFEDLTESRFQNNVKDIS